MKTKEILFIFFLVNTIPSLYSQIKSPFHSRPEEKNSEYFIGFNDYQHRGKQKGDTIWLAKKEIYFFWNGDSLVQAETYLLIDYNMNIGKLSHFVIMDTFTNDSLEKKSYTYGEDEKERVNTYETFNNETQSWQFDHRELFSYDDYGNKDTTIYQVWDRKHRSWHNLNAKIIKWIDTVQVSEYVLMESVDEKWRSIFGFKNIYRFNNQGYIYDTYQKVLDPATQEWVNSNRGELTLNNDGSWNECTIYAWDETNRDWVMTQKNTVEDWITYNRYPFSSYNQATVFTRHLWLNNEWFAYHKEVFEFINQNSNSYTMKYFSSSSPDEPLFFSDTLYFLNRSDKLKQRYWHKSRTNPNEAFRIIYDDSCRWYFFKGTLQELYQISIDTATNQWRPATRVVDSDFIPFVEVSEIEEHSQKSQKLTIIPNPSDNIIEIVNKHHFTEIALFDIKGSLIAKKEAQLEQSKIVLDVRQLPPGMYVLKAISTDNKIVSDKLIVK